MKIDKERQTYLIGKANETYEVQCLLMAMRLGLAASGIHRGDFDLLLAGAIDKLKFISSALGQEANRPLGR